jgi:Dynamitin
MFWQLFLSTSNQPHKIIICHIFQLEGLKNLSASKKVALSGGSSDASSVLYELMMKPETSKLEETRRVAEIERRLEAMEKAVGATSDKMVGLSSLVKKPCGRVL